MKLQKAIEIKEAYHWKFEKHMLSGERLADMLSIEALKRHQIVQRLDPKLFGKPLPGETV